MTTNEIIELCQRLKKEREALSEMKKKLAACNLSGHQKRIKVLIGDGSIAVNVTEMNRGYSESLIRGREMILLGVKKAIQAAVDEQESLVSRIEEAINSAKVDA